MPAYLNSLNNFILRANLPADKDPRKYGKLELVKKKKVKVWVNMFEMSLQLMGDSVQTNALIADISFI